jgi:large subunit ribosomal protein LP0
VNVDNVTSTQMHQIRASIRSDAVILMGKNTMVRKAMREVLAENPKLEAIVPCIRGNVGLVFTNGDLKDVRDRMLSNRVQAAAKIGLTAQEDIFVPAGNTGMDPNKTSFFQALGISTKVVKGAIEITSDVLLIKAGQKVGPSEATLLNLLNLTPFSFGLTVLSVYDNGSLFEPAMLDITDAVLETMLQNAIKSVAAISLATGIPTVASAPHSLINAFKNLLGVALATDLSFPEADKVREALKNVSAAPAAAAAPAKGAAAPAAAKEAVKAESEEDEDMGFGLFD